MRYFFYILFSLLLFVFAQTTTAIDLSTVQIDLQTESSNVNNTEIYHKRDLLNYEVARTFSFDRNFVNYWERGSEGLATAGSRFKTVEEFIEAILSFGRGCK
jgi:hypothetical protein